MSTEKPKRNVDQSASGQAPPQAAAPPPANAGAARAPAQSRRGRLRASLLLLGPIVVLAVAGYVYMKSGRYASTDNAYVKSDKVIVSAEVSGPITHVEVHENEHVKKNDVLFVIDDGPYRVALERAEAQLAAVDSFIESLEASYRQRLEQLELARMNVAYTEHELERETGLAERGLGSDVDVDRARHEYDVARQQIPILNEALAQLRAQLGGDLEAGIRAHPAYRAAKSAVDGAKLDLELTVVRAPFGGVASRVPVTGQYVAPGTAAMSIVADGNAWIEANFKETDLAHVEVGQPARILIDTYPDRDWRGTVESIGQATGAEFSVIPAQNASGNWVKVTQRIPVRISVRVAENDPTLRSGMSSTVEIDTGYQRPAPKFLSFLLPRDRARVQTARGD
jgi:membrane fusion protein, multidrug efflux system